MAGLGFLSPWFLLGALVAAVPIALHLFRRETAPLEPFSAVEFVEATPVEQARQRRLRDLWLLALRVAAVCALALAFARPFLHGPAAATAEHVTVIALDVSASMGAPATWAAARQMAREAAASAPAGAVGLITFADRARVAIEPVGDRGAVVSAIDQLTAGAGGTRFEPAVAAAVGAIGDRRGRVVLVSDLQAWGLQGSGRLPAGIDLVVRPIRTATANLAVTSLERDGANSVAALVENDGAETIDASVRFEIDGRPLGSARVRVAAGGTSVTRLRVPLPGSGVLTAEAADAEGPPADNRRVLVLDAAVPVPVLVLAARRGADDPALFVRAALEAAEGDAMAPVSAEVVAPDDPRLGDAAFVGRFRVVFVLATRGLDRRAREALGAFPPGGGGLFVAAGPEIEPRVVEEWGGTPAPLRISADDEGAWPATLAAVDPRHAVVAALGPLADRLAHVRVDRGVRIEVTGAADVVAMFTNGWPALVEVRRGDGRLLVLASDVGREWNTFPIHAAFAPFIYEVARDLSGAAGSGGALTPADVDEAVAVPGAVARGRPPRRLAVNLDPRESRLAPATPDAIDAAFPRDEATGRESAATGNRGARRDHGWRVILLVLAALLVVEALLSPRAVSPHGASRPAVP